MKRKSFAAIPFVFMPVFIVIYRILDSLIFVEVFGCGCVQTFNANDLQRIVFPIVTIILTISGIYIAKAFQNWRKKIVYCVAVLIENVLLSNWVLNTFMWK